MSSQATLSITGMHCASCAAIITRRLKKTSGVEEVNVNYGSQKARVRFDPTQTNDQALIAAVKAAGYGATIANEHDREADKKRRKAEITGYRKRFFIGLVLSLPMLYFMARAFLPFLPFPPSLNSWMGIASLLLATPVQFWLGAGFYKGFWSSLKMGTFNMDSLIAIGTSTAYVYSLYNFVVYSRAAGTLFGEIPN